MNKFIIPALFFIGALSLKAQTDKATLLQNLEANQTASQENPTTATVKSSTRLFRIKEDLTSVIMIIPSGSVVSVIESDSTYLHVSFQDNEGYIFKKHAVFDKAPATFKEMQSGKAVKEVQPSGDLNDSRYNALESKYGSAMALRLYAGKIWKGMNSEMVKDSWGTAQKINRVISGIIIREEWIFKNTWLYFENNILLGWGPIK